MMKLVVSATKEELGKKSSAHAAALINKAIEENGSARILLSTGASQFPFFEEFVKENIDWSRVEMFHLDEYVGISEEHPASFKRYLIDRFVAKVNPGKVHLINGSEDPQKTIAALTALLEEKPVDVGLIGIGENAHIAFNDPPADFEAKEAYRVVTLAERCLQQQIGEGWFKSVEETYKQAISMTAPQIMKCKSIISVVPYKVKAEAIYNTLVNDVTPDVPATLMKRHADCTVYCDADSASLLSDELVKKYQ
jgi:glucosamine-6-phosphate deaminase